LILEDNMSKSQFIKNDKVCLSHSSSREDVEFVFSVDKSFNDITITMILDNKDNRRHIEVEHEIMSCAIPYLIEWLQEKQNA